MQEYAKGAGEGLQPRGRGSLPRLPPDAEARQGCDAGVRQRRGSLPRLPPDASGCDAGVGQRRWEGFEGARGV